MFDIEILYEETPPGLAQIEPGPQLAAILADIDVDAVSPRDRITVLRLGQIPLEVHVEGPLEGSPDAVRRAATAV